MFNAYNQVAVHVHLYSTQDTIARVYLLITGDLVAIPTYASTFSKQREFFLLTITVAP